jgi:hypothetical protein
VPRQPESVAIGVQANAAINNAKLSAPVRNIAVRSGMAPSRSLA